MEFNKRLTPGQKNLGRLYIRIQVGLASSLRSYSHSTLVGDAFAESQSLESRMARLWLSGVSFGGAATLRPLCE
jgi:hypothetical protein